MEILKMKKYLKKNKTPSEYWALTEKYCFCSLCVCH